MDKSLMYYVNWVDSVGQGCESWMTIEEIESEACSCHTVGYLISENDDAVTITATVTTVTGVDQFDGYITIPRAAIKKMVRLELPVTKTRIPTGIKS